MTRRVAALAAVAGLALTASCGATTPVVTERPGLDYPLDGVVSVCDRFGHRIYLGRVNSGSAMAVVPNDPSCGGPR